MIAIKTHGSGFRMSATGGFNNDKGHFGLKNSQLTADPNINL
jgi:hypothetical protein